MSIVGRLPRPVGMGPKELERAILSVFGGGSTSSGVSVSSDSAMRQATVYSCVNILSRAIRQLPCHLMLEDGRTRKPAREEPLYRLLHRQPNEWQTAPEFWGMCMNHLALRGNFFALKNRGGGLTGPVRELVPLAPGMVQDVKQDKNFRLVYAVRFPDGTIKEIPRDQIFHIRGMTENGILGVNPIQYLRETIGFSLAAEEFGARYFGSGTHPGMIVEHPGKLSPEGHTNLQTALTETYAGLGKSHRLMLLQENMKAQKITIDPKDAQFLELRQFQKAEIENIFFGLPLTVMTSGDKAATYASAEQFSLSFVVYAITPYLVDIERAISRDLIEPERQDSLYAKFQVGGLLRGSMKERADYYEKMWRMKAMNSNEIRALEDMNPYDGGDEFTNYAEIAQKDEPKKGDEK